MDKQHGTVISHHPDPVLEDVEIPLKNVEYVIDQYLLAHGTRLDTETRFLLAGIRDCVGRIASSTRAINAANEIKIVPEILSEDMVA